MKLPTGLDIGTMIYMIDAATHVGRDVWQCSTRGLVTVNGSASFSRVLCEKESFAPIDSHWKHSLLGEADAVYGDGQVKIDVSGKDESVTLEIDSTAYDNEQCVELFRRLPLKTGYRATLTVISSLASMKIDVALDVPEVETIETPAGTFECFKLVLNIGQTFWISNDEHRYVVRFAAGGMTADLVRVAARKPGEIAEVQGDGYSLTLPAGWHSYTADKAANEEAQGAFLLDPRAITQARVTVVALDKLTAEERESTAAWTESVIAKLKDKLKDFKVREPGVEDGPAGERTGSVLIADYTEDGEARTIYGLAVFGDQRAASLRFDVEADHFEELREDFDAIAGSLKLE
jgi:hypothetical protein